MARIGALAHPLRARLTLLALCVAAVAGLALLSLVIGARQVPATDVLRALIFSGGPSVMTDDTVVIRTLRLPRTVIGVVVGAALGLAGALMQALTRNPLADPGVLGVNAGASFCVVLALALGWGGALGSAAAGMFGAAAAVCVVLLLSSPRAAGVSSVRLILVGAATSAVLGGLTSALVVLDAGTFDQVRFWTIGSLAGRDTALVWPSVALVVAAVLGSLALAASLDSLALGDDVATGLGARVGHTRILGALAVAVLCGTATAVAGPIGFVGLAVPHLARMLAGPSARWLLVFSAVLGAALVLGADVVGRLIAGAGEVQAGLMTAAIGGPLFVVLARRRKLAAL